VSKTGVKVEDLESTNGTRINGAPCSAGTITPGDWLEVGAVALFLEEVPVEESEVAIELGVPGLDSGRRRSPETSTELAVRRPREPGWLRLLRGLAQLKDRTQLDRELVRGARDLTGATAVALMDGATVLALDGSAAVLEGGEPLRVSVSGDVELVLCCDGQPPDDTVQLALRLAVQLRRQRTASAPGGDGDAGSALRLPADHVEGRSAPARRLYEEIRAALRSSAPVLVTGETGVGKEHVVRILHASSPRADGPLQSLSCAAIPTELLEAELFGIEAGVATGVSARPGAMRLADGGTLFFDEIGVLAPSLQTKLLRALQEAEIQPVGARRPVPVNVRIVAATNSDLEAAVRGGSFRADLYYRLAGHHIHVPTLRERAEDIPELIEHFLRAAADGSGIRPAGLSVAALTTLQAAPWPGNVRQLANELRRAVAAAGPGAVIERRHLSQTLLEPTAPDSPPADDDLDLRRQVERLERRLVERAIHLADGNLAEAARTLGLSRNGLVMKMQRLGVGRSGEVGGG
jgi:two-component system NtrC family response regulator